MSTLLVAFTRIVGDSTTIVLSHDLCHVGGYQPSSEEPSRKLTQPLSFCARPGKLPVPYRRSERNTTATPAAGCRTLRYYTRSRPLRTSIHSCRRSQPVPPLLSLSGSGSNGFALFARDEQQARSGLILLQRTWLLRFKGRYGLNFLFLMMFSSLRTGIRRI
jgi:hypothetical protein